MFRFLLIFLLQCTIYFGFAFPNLEPHIVGGFDIDIKRAPYQAALVYPLGCGAVVISEKYLVTAAHCCSRGWKARLGSNYHSKGGTIVDIKKHTRHPKYNEKKSLDYDVCVLEAEEKIVFGEAVKPIVIADKEPNAEDIVRVTGWGRVAENGNLSPTLKAVDIPVTNRTYCKKAYSSLTERMICAGVEGKDSCQGDSGGPLTFNGKLVGVVSFGKGCAVKNYPGVYALLTNTEIRGFIKNVTGV